LAPFLFYTTLSYSDRGSLNIILLARAHAVQGAVIIRKYEWKTGEAVCFFCRGPTTGVSGPT